jgi:hypothetical protein
MHHCAVNEVNLGTEPIIQADWQNALLLNDKCPTTVNADTSGECIVSGLSECSTTHT